LKYFTEEITAGGIHADLDEGTQAFLVSVIVYFKRSSKSYSVEYRQREAQGVAALSTPPP